MKMKLQHDDLAHYLAADEIIDFGYDISREVTELAYDITTYSENEIDYVKNAYEYVRDQISHSADVSGKIVTCTASEVLKAKEGICFAKSHLLAAILRSNLIPAGFCYQRLILDDDTAPQLILHGLNAVYLESLDQWIRLDARGNKPGVNAQFSTTDEQLAFPVRSEKGEEDIPVIFAKPDANVIAALKKYQSFELLWENLPAEVNQGL